MLNKFQLHEINTKQQEISATGFLAVSWYDLRLSWNESNYDGLDHIALNPTELWLPSFVMGNTVSQQLFNKEWYYINKVQVSLYSYSEHIDLNLSSFFEI